MPLMRQMARPKRIAVVLHPVVWICILKHSHPVFFPHLLLSCYVISAAPGGAFRAVGTSALGSYGTSLKPGACLNL
jgi:hypothetical protein